MVQWTGIRRKLFAVGTAALVFVATAHLTVQAGEDLPSRVRAIMEAYKIADGSVSVWVEALDEPRPRLAVNANAPKNPASVMKLFTTYAALHELGPAYTWTSRIYADGPVRDGILDGDLWIRGAGDPYLLAKDVWKLVGEIRGRGIRHILGDLVLDVSAFPPSATDPGSFDSRPFRAYNQQPHPLLVNFNVLDFELAPTTDGRSVRVRTYPPVMGLPVHSRISIAPGPCRGYQRGVAYHVASGDAGNEVILEGRYPAGCGRYRITRAALSPEQYAHGLFKALWQQWGGEFDGDWRIAQWPAPAADPLAVHESRPLAEVVRLVNKYSNNVMAQHLALTLAPERQASPAAGENRPSALMESLARSGVDPHGMIIDNAAGLSRNNRVTARQVAQLLRTARNSLVMPEFTASLAIAGVDGTVRNRFRGTPLAGRMRLKTGRLDHVSGVAGYVRSAKGEELLVVVLVNAEDAHRGPGKELQDAVLRWAYHS